MGALPQAETAQVDLQPVAVEIAGGAGRFVVLCDHASNFVPPEYADLGLTPEELAAHIAWDPGALGVARALARMLDAPLVYATISRLVIDCNRPLDAPDLVAETSETTAVPGNAHLSETERRRRMVRVHEPYHHAIDQLVGERLAAGTKTALLAIHSFTPVYRGIARPWPVGVIFDRDRTLAHALIEGLKGDGLNVGVNEPYSPADRVYYTLSRHAEAHNLPCAMIEIRNDLIRSEAEQADWARRIGAHLASTVAVTASSREPSV